MEHFWNYGIWDLQEITLFLSEMWSDFIHVVYESDWSWLFMFPLFVALCSMCIDIIFSLVLSFRSREVKIFNAFSPKSWSLLVSHTRNCNRVGISENKYRSRDWHFRQFSLTPFAFRLRYKKAKAGDIIKCKDGQKTIYGGIYMGPQGQILYKYKTQNGVYFSTMNPYDWSNSNGSQRLDSAVMRSNYKKGG